MAASATVIAALKYHGGVVIGADSQTSDMVANVKWPTDKLEMLSGGYPCVVGFSGATGKAQQAKAAFKDKPLHANQFKKRELVRQALDKSLQPIMLGIKEANPNPSGHPLWEIALWGLSGLWAEGGAQILEFEVNGASCFHDYFHAIGSGSNTAYAVYRTLGGERLCELDARRAIMALVRILRTSVGVEFVGVSEPLSMWSVDQDGAREMLSEELDTHLQAVEEWEAKERTFLFEAD